MNIAVNIYSGKEKNKRIFVGIDFFLHCFWCKTIYYTFYCCRSSEYENTILFGREVFRKVILVGKEKKKIRLERFRQLNVM